MSNVIGGRRADQRHRRRADRLRQAAQVELAGQANGHDATSVQMMQVEIAELAASDDTVDTSGGDSVELLKIKVA